MARTLEQQITDFRFILQRLTLDVYEEKTLKSLLAYYEQMAKEFIGELATKARSDSELAALKLAKKDVTRFVKETKERLKVMSEALVVPVATATGEAGEFSYLDTNKILSWDGTVPGYHHGGLSARQISGLAMTQPMGGKTLFEWIAAGLVPDDLDLKREIDSMRSKGWGYNKMLEETTKSFAKYLDTTAKQHLETITKSYIQAANAKAHQDIYAQNKNLINKVEWSAIMENANVETGRGTCPRCMALDGQRYNSIKNGPPCPLHARCRCMYLPVVKTWQEILGGKYEGVGARMDKSFAEIEAAAILKGEPIRAKGNLVYERNLLTIAEQEARNAVVNAQRAAKGLAPLRTMDYRQRKYGATMPAFQERQDKTYAEWWATKPKRWQNNAIGETRAELVRKELVDFEDLVHHDKKDKRLADLGYKLGDLILLEDLPALPEKKKKK